MPRRHRRATRCGPCCWWCRRGPATPDDWRRCPGSWRLLRHWPLCSLEDGIWPAHDNGGTPRSVAAIAETDRGASAFQQRLGDENAQPHVTFLTLARGNEGRAELVEQRFGEAWPGVRVLDLGPFGGPTRSDEDLAMGEGHRVLH